MGPKPYDQNLLRHDCCYCGESHQTSLLMKVPRQPQMKSVCRQAGKPEWNLSQIAAPRGVIHGERFAELGCSALREGPCVNM